ncbi:MAG: hypothetical protein ABIK65_02555 [Candidatus Eisenbacteria bacterium]
MARKSFAWVKAMPSPPTESTRRVRVRPAAESTSTVSIRSRPMLVRESTWERAWTQTVPVRVESEGSRVTSMS